MDENFSRIEDYINNKLSGTEKGKFESELKSNTALAEKFNFYRNLQGQQSPELKPIKFTKKILPEINDINFTEKKQKPGIGKGSAAGILIIFIAVSGYLLLSNVSQNKNIAKMQSIIDSINTQKEQFANTVQKNNFQELTNNSDSVTMLQQMILSKEKEIALLKTDNEENKTLKDEVGRLKKELAKIKQEYYENSGAYASNSSNSLMSKISSNFNFTIRFQSIDVKWNKGRYKIEIYNSKGNLIKSSSDFIEREWLAKLPEPGFYKLRIKSSTNEVVYVVVEASGKGLGHAWIRL